MYQSNNRNNTVVRSILFTVSIAFFFVVQAALANRFDVETACLNAVPVDLATTHRGYEAAADTAHLVRLDVPSAGILAVDVTASDSQGSEPRMGFFRDRCGEGRSGDDDVTTIEQSAAHLVLAVRTPGTYYFRLGAQDPSQALGEYKLTTGFVAATVSEDEFSLEPELTGFFGAEQMTVTRTHFFAADFLAKGGEEEADPGEGTKSQGSRGRFLVSVASLYDATAAKGGEEEADPGEGTYKGGEEEADPGEGTYTQKGGEEEADPGEGTKSSFGPASARLVLSYAGMKKDGLAESARTDLVRQILWPEAPAHQAMVRSSAVSELHFELDQLCRQGERDDHGDTFSCSTSIVPGELLTGEIGNGLGDDHDTFAFTLSELRTVRIEAAGEIEADVTVYDRFGQRLESQDGRLVRTLPPGRYFVQISTSDHTEGAYQLGVELLGW